MSKNSKQPVNPDLNERREFLKFLGVGTTATVMTQVLPGLLGSASAVGQTNSSSMKKKKSIGELPEFTPLKPTIADEVRLAEGFHHRVIVKWNDPIGKFENKKIYFGTNCDFIGFKKLSRSSAQLFINHESFSPTHVTQTKKFQIPTKEQFVIQRKCQGASLIHVIKRNGVWGLDSDNKNNLRLDGETVIPFAWDEPIQGAKVAVGTIENCSGGETPWGTFLTCEENYQNEFGEVEITNSGERIVNRKEARFMWHEIEDLPPEHYGWVVEFDPKTKKAKKLISMGRFAHEGATLVVAKDGRPVVYMGDDSDGQYIYKFIASEKGSLEKGELFVANVKTGNWLSLDLKKNKKLQRQFKSQTEVLIHARRAAKILGATPMNRPEDIAVNPVNGDVIVALTNSKLASDPYGSLGKIKENDQDPLSLKFEFSTFLVGGKQSGVACPDNLVFDKSGHLWVTTDIGGRGINKPPYDGFGNNALFVIPMSGPFAGIPKCVATAPIEAEFTGPCFSDDGETLFLSVQHPGEETEVGEKYSSHWPEGGDSIPRSAVIAIQFG